MPWALTRRLYGGTATQVAATTPAAGAWGSCGSTATSRVARAADGLGLEPSGRPPARRRDSPAVLRRRRGDDVRDVELDLDWCTPLQPALATRCGRPLRRDRHLRRARGARRPPGAARRGPSAPQPLPLIVPCHRVVAAGGLGGYGSLGVEYKRRCWRSRVPLSEDVGASSPRSRRSATATGSPSSRALPHGREPPPARHGELRPPRRLRVRRRPPRVRLLRASASRRDPDLPQRAFDGRRATSCTCRGRAPLRCCTRPALVGARAARGAAEAGRRARVLPSRVPARRAARRRVGQRAARAAPRDPDARVVPAPSSCVGRRPGGRAPARPRPRAGTRSPTRRARSRSPTCSPWPARATRRSRSTSTPSSPRRVRARTGSRTPTTRTSSARAAPPTSRSRRSGGSRRTARLATAAAEPPRDRRAAPAPSLALAARARGEMPAAGHEGRRAPPAAQAGLAWPNTTCNACSFTRSDASYFVRGGSALVRRWIQTPSAGTVLSAVQPEGKVVLGASPPARRLLLRITTEGCRRARRLDSRQDNELGGHHGEDPRRHQRLRPHRAQLLPRAPAAGRRLRDRRGQRPRRREDDGAPAPVRLDARPARRGRRGRRRHDPRGRLRAQDALRARPGGAAVGRPRRRRRPRVDGLLHRRATARRSTSTPARRRSSSRRRRPIRTSRSCSASTTTTYDPAAHHIDLERVLHDELRRADGEGAARRVRRSSRAS